MSHHIIIDDLNVSLPESAIVWNQDIAIDYLAILGSIFASLPDELRSESFREAAHQIETEIENLRDDFENHETEAYDAINHPPEEYGLPKQDSSANSAWFRNSHESSFHELAGYAPPNKTGYDYDND